MSKKQTYLYILAAGIILILAGFFHAHLADNLCLPHHRQNGRQSFGFRTGSRLRLYLYGKRALLAD